MNNQKMHTTKRRAVLLAIGFLLAGWLLFTNYPSVKSTDQEATETISKDVSLENAPELKVTLLLLGLEFVIQRR